jgi:spore germination protein
MYNQDKYMISPLEMSISLIAFIIGVGILTLPGALADTLDTSDGWISILITGFIVMVLVFSYTYLQKQFPGQTLLQYLRQGSFGKWWALIIAVSFIVYFISLIGFEARVLGIVLNLYLLDRTPAVVIAATILLVTTYAVSKGVPGIIHLNVLFTPIILLVLLGIISFNIEQVEAAPILPVIPKGFVHVLQAVPDTALSFAGIEILLFLMAHMKADKLRAWPLNTAICVIVLAYILVTFFTYFTFSVDEAKVISFGTVELAKEIDIPGGFFERIESLMITVWTMSIFNTIAMSHLLAVHVLKDQFFRQSDPTNMQQKEAKRLSAVVVFIAFLIAFMPNSITETHQVGDWLGILGVSLYICSIVIGYCTVWWRKKTDVEKEQSYL